MNANANDLTTGLLRSVSRSFYLTLRAMPAPVRSQLGVAYLLARATDTIADTEVVPVQRRLLALCELRERILGTCSSNSDFATFQAADPVQATEGERALLQRIDDVIGALDSFADEDQQRIRDVLVTITGGQELDLRRFEHAGAGHIVALQTPDELDDYTFRVAGCVGEFWTRLCRAHLFAGERLDDAFLLTNGVRFGKGLQLVNILRDIPKDLRVGRCYLPADDLAAAGLLPTDLLDPLNEQRVRVVYDRWWRQAEAHLAAGWEYTNALPRKAVRARLACAWPILLGAQTLTRLRREPVLDPGRRVKVSRAQVRSTMFRTIVRYPIERWWRRLFDEARA